MSSLQLKKLALITSGPLACLLVTMMPLSGMPTDAKYTLAIAAWIVVWWVTEAVPIAVASLMPIVLFPIFNVLSISEVCSPYGHRYVFLFLGGFLLALALEKWDLHKRIALGIIKKTGTGTRSMIFGFMLASALLSMWISNTATTLMMLPIATSVVALLKMGSNEKQHKRFALIVMLAIAYGANIGGIGTLVGTPPNAAMAGILSEQYNINIGFGEWMGIAAPFSFVLLFVVYFLLVYVVHPVKNEKTDSGHELIKEELKKLGRLSSPQFKVLMIFFTTAALWILRSTINSTFGAHLDDTMISIAAGVSLFLVPSGNKNKDGKVGTLLEWEQTQKLPWGILLLFGGGMALAAAFKSSGLINFIGDYFASLSNYPILVLVVLLAIAALFATELMSNLALVNVLIPVVAVIAVGMDLDPMIFAVPVTLAASCAFMLPMATPPNAIVFASGHVGIKQMALSGLVMNLVASGLIALWVSICVHFSWL